jgi:hypothetical protein
MGFFIFIIGFIIFTTYVMFFMFSINNENKDKIDLKDDIIDYDGHGNWGRFPPTKKERKRKIKI